MRNPFHYEENEALNTEIDRIFTQMHLETPGSKEYTSLLHQVERLQKMRHEDKPNRLSRDTMFTGGVMLFGTVLLMMYEQKHVVLGQKSWNFLPKPK